MLAHTRLIRDKMWMSAPVNPNTIRFILATIFIDAVGFGIVMPVAPRLLMAVGHVDLSGATYLGTLLSLLYAAMQFMFGTIIGNLGDRFGRRPVLLGALAGFSINFLLQAQAQSLLWLFAGQAVAGVFGGTYAPAQAALADITQPEERARVFGYVGAAFGLGFILGPVIGGLIGSYGPRVPFYAAAGLAALNCVYGLTVFPETLPKALRRPFDWKRANPLGALMALKHLPGIDRLSLVLLSWQVASLVYPLTWSYYMMASFGASSRLIGLSLALVGVSVAVVQMLVTGRMVKRFGERRTAQIGLAMAMWTFAAFALASINPWFILLALTMPLGNLVQPALMAMLAARANATNQGEMQGFIACVMALGSIFAPLLFNPTLAYFISPHAPIHFGGAAFVLAVILAVLALILLSFTPRRTAVV